MTDRKLAVVVSVVLLCAASLSAQQMTHGVVHSTAKRVAPQDSLTFTFDPTPVGQSNEQDCFYDCFYQFGSPPDSSSRTRAVE